MNHSTNEKKCCDLCNESFIGCRQADCPCHRAEKRCEACEIERAVPQPQGDHTCLLRGPRQDTTTTNSEKNSNGIVVPDTEEWEKEWRKKFGDDISAIDTIDADVSHEMEAFISNELKKRDDYWMKRLNEV